MATKKPKQFKPKVEIPLAQFETNRTLDMESKFIESWKLKNIISTVPTYAPKNEFECYVRYVNGATYKLYVYLGTAVGWKSVTLA